MIKTALDLASSFIPKGFYKWAILFVVLTAVTAAIAGAFNYVERLQDKLVETAKRAAIEHVTAEINAATAKIQADWAQQTQKAMGDLNARATASDAKWDAFELRPLLKDDKHDKPVEAPRVPPIPVDPKGTGRAYPHKPVGKPAAAGKRASGGADPYDALNDDALGMLERSSRIPVAGGGGG